MTSRLVILLLVPLAISLGLNTYMLSVNVPNQHNMDATYDVSSFSQDFGLYQGNPIQHSDVYIVGTIFDGARTNATPSSQTWTLTANHPIPNQNGNYSDTVAWASTPFASDTVIDGIAEVNIWASSGSRCGVTCGSGFAAAIAELNPNNNRTWNSQIVGSGQHGQALPPAPTLEQIAIPVQNHKVLAGDRVVFVFGIGSIDQTYSAVVYFGSQPYFSSASLPEVGTSFNVSPYYIFAEGSSNSYANMNLTVHIIVPSGSTIYVKWSPPDWTSSPNEVIAYVTIAHANRTDGQWEQCPPYCKSPQYFMVLTANTKYTLELQTTDIQDRPFTTPKYPSLTPLTLLLLLVSVLIPASIAKRRLHVT